MDLNTMRYIGVSSVVSNSPNFYFAKIANNDDKNNSVIEFLPSVNTSLGANVFALFLDQ
jgi:hypothetical protein